MITRVRLTSWKSHLDSEMTFSKGVNALVGIMGAGKSSVMDAISFGLFGSFPSLQARKLTLDDLIMSNPQKKEVAGVELEFLVNGKTYSIKREIKKGKGSSAEIRENGVLREVSSRGVTTEVERLLKMDYEMFSRAVYSEQNGLDYFLKIPAGQRRLHIDRLLRVDRYETVREGAVSIQNRLKVGVEEKITLTMEMEKEDLPGKIQKLEGEIGEFSQLIEKLQEKKEEAGKKRSELESQLKEREQKEKELEKTRRLLEGLKGGMQELTERAAKNKKLTSGKDLSRLDTEVRFMEKEIAAKRKDTDLLKGKFTDATTRQKVAQEAIDTIEEAGDVCPLCESEIMDERKEEIVNGKVKLIQSLREDAVKWSHGIYEKEQEIGFLEKALAEKRVEKERTSLAFQEIREMEGKLKEILALRSQYEGKVRELENEPTADLGSLRTHFQEVLAEERGLEVEISGLRSRVDDRVERRGELSQRQKILEEYRTAVAGEREVLSQLNVFETVLKATQEGLRKEFLANVNAIMGKVWGELYPYGDIDSLKLEAEEGDYALQIRRGGEWVDAEVASGGERTLACLALRVAFSLAFLPNLKWLILDEPTHNLDRNAIVAFSEALQEGLPQLAEQIFLITHDPSLSEGLGNIYRLDRDRSAGGATKIAD